MHILQKKVPVSVISLFIMISLVQLTSYVKAQGYSRKSLTILMLSHSNDKPIPRTYYSNLVVSDRHDFNNIGTNRIDVDFPFSSVGNFSTDNLTDKIYEDRIPNKILRSILIDEAKQFMTVDVITKRGLYNSSDADYVVARNSARGIDILKDSGVKLLRDIYFLVIKPNNFSVIKNEATKANNYSLSGTGYLFQLDLDSTYMSSKFWEDFYFDSRNPEKLEKLMNYRFPIKSTSSHFISNVSDLDGASTVSSGLQLFANALANNKQQVDESLLIRKSTNEIYRQLISRASSSCLSSIESADNFVVRSSVYKSHPLLAKIGKKENLRTDHLYLVKERVLDKRTGKVESREVGYVRAKWVADNRLRTNDVSKPSSFYRVSSGIIRKGMELEDASDKDSKFTIGASYNKDNTHLLGGYFLNSEYITHWLPGLNLGIDLGFNPELISTDVTYLDKRTAGQFSGMAASTALTLRQSFSYHRLSITPVGGMFLTYTQIDDGTVKGKDNKVINSSRITNDYTKVHGILFGGVYGGDVGFNLGRTLQIHVGYRFTEMADGIYETEDTSNAFAYATQYSKKTITFGLRFGRL